MASLNGDWNVVIKSPLGDQTGVLAVKTSGDTFTGIFVGSLGSTPAKNGKVDGSRLTWTMDITVPMAAAVQCEATVDGNEMSGTVENGIFGSYPLTGTRA